MQKVSEVLALFISQSGQGKRTPQEKIYLDYAGVINDKFYDKGRERSVLLTTQESYKIVKNQGISIEEGALGENILIEYNYPQSLSSGLQLKVGTVILEIAQNCTICNHLSVIDKKVPKLLKDDRGMFAKVIQAGCITKGDKIELIEKY